MYGSNFAILFLLSLYLQYIKGYGPAYAGQILLTQALLMAIVAPFAGKLADRFEPRVIATLGCAIVGIGFVLLIQLSTTTSASYISLSLALMGLGFGLFSTPNNSAIMGAVNEQEVGVASASMNLSRTIGNLFGMSLVNLMMHYYIGEATFSSENTAQLMSTISLALTMSLSFVIIATLVSAMRGRQ
jgi:MFS family permease